MNSLNLKHFLDGRSLFSAIKDVELFPFLDGGDDATLDTMLNVFHGSSAMFVPMVDCSLEVIAKMIVIKHGKQWRELITLEVQRENLETTREVTEEIDDLETRTNEKTDTNKVSGFNSDVLLDNDGSVSTGEEGLTGKRTRNTLDTYKDGVNVYKLLSTSAKTSIVNAVLKDVKRFLTLSIY